jgi:hypothetical protein
MYIGGIIIMDSKSFSGMEYNTWYIWVVVCNILCISYLVIILPKEIIIGCKICGRRFFEGKFFEVIDGEVRCIECKEIVKDGENIVIGVKEFRDRIYLAYSEGLDEGWDGEFRGGTYKSK